MSARLSLVLVLLVGGMFSALGCNEDSTASSDTGSLGQSGKKNSSGKGGSGSDPEEEGGSGGSEDNGDAGTAGSGTPKGGAGAGGNPGAGGAGSGQAGTGEQGGQPAAGSGPEAGAGGSGEAGSGAAGGPEAGAGGSAPTGACTNPSDKAISTSPGISDQVTACGTDCFFQGGGEACYTNCMQQKTGMSAPCAACWGANINCGATKCFNECLAGSSSPACLQCNATNCDAAYIACSGLTHSLPLVDQQRGRIDRAASLDVLEQIEHLAVA